VRRSCSRPDASVAVRRGGMRVVVQHVSQDVLGILQALGHLGVATLKSLVEWESRSLTPLVHVGH